MADPDRVKHPTGSLRQRAESRLEVRDALEADEPDMQGLRGVVRELHLQEIELELQNEDLRNAHQRLQESRTRLAVSEQRYRELFEQAPNGYLRLDVQGVILEANQTAAALLAAPSHELAGRRLSDFITRESQDAYYAHRRGALAGERPSPTLVTLHTVEGSLRDVELGARRTEGEPSELRVAILDVTARERAEAAHLESERHRRLIANALPLAVAYVGGDGRFRFCNPAFTALYGPSRRPVEGRPIYEVLDEPSYRTLREQMRAALDGTSARYEGELSFPDHQRRFVTALFAPDHDPAGREVAGFYLLLDDRTELEQTRQHLRAVAAQAALAEERERRTLAADLHDGAGQLLALATMKLRELHERAGADAASAPIGEITDLVRTAHESITALSFDISPPLLYDVGLVAALEWLADRLQREYGLQVALDTEVPEVPEIDEPTRVTLFRALRELLINVARHAGTKQGKVTIRRHSDELLVTVEDHGHGFVPDASHRGFGLKTVLDRLAFLGGQVAIESAPEEGARVTLRVPLRTATPP